MYRIILLLSFLFISFNSYAVENDLITDSEVMMLEPSDWIPTKYIPFSSKEKQLALNSSKKCPEIYSVKIGKPIKYQSYKDNNKTIIMLKISEYQRLIRLINNAIYYKHMFMFIDNQYHCSNFAFFDTARNTMYRFSKDKFILTSYFQVNFPSFEYKYNVNNANYIFFSINQNELEKFVKFIEYIYNYVNYSSKSFYRYNKIIEK